MQQRNPNDTRIEEIPLDQLVTSEGTQPRDEMDVALVAQYAEEMERGDQFPPIEVVETPDGKFIVTDGFHRKSAAIKAGLDTFTCKVEQGDLEYARWVSLSANATHGKRRTRADKRRAIKRALKGWGTEKSDNQIAQHVGCSQPTVSKYRKELENDPTSKIYKSDEREGADGRTIDTSNIGGSDPTKETVDEVESMPDDVEESMSEGMLSGDEAEEVASLDEPEREKVHDQVERGEADDVDDAVRSVKRERRKQERRKRVQELEDKAPPLDGLDQRFAVLYADPPWQYDHTRTDNRKIENHYPTMDLDAICDLSVDEVATDDAVLFMWATNPKLAEAMRVIDAWGFRYKTNMVWDKEKIGMGYYARQQHELLLVATKGSPPAPDAGDRPSSVYREPRGEHSAKPEHYYELIQRLYPDFSKLELFARDNPEGWNVWGNEAETNE
jgi:N6-adenosine-specific RNA methylase IME4